MKILDAVFFVQEREAIRTAPECIRESVHGIHRVAFGHRANASQSNARLAHPAPGGRGPPRIHPAVELRLIIDAPVIPEEVNNLLIVN